VRQPADLPLYRKARLNLQVPLNLPIRASGIGGSRSTDSKQGWSFNREILAHGSLAISGIANSRRTLRAGKIIFDFGQSSIDCVMGLFIERPSRRLSSARNTSPALINLNRIVPGALRPGGIDASLGFIQGLQAGPNERRSLLPYAKPRSAKRWQRHEAPRGGHRLQPAWHGGAFPATKEPKEVAGRPRALTIADDRGQFPGPTPEAPDWGRPFSGERGGPTSKRKIEPNA
jgi:hypothetical protein